ncbi:MAG: hypothetical protein MSS66_07175 [Selenomonadaceae bacterium]|nr:hypothetical protein [Selenomonadaceae bacterium]
MGRFAKLWGCLCTLKQYWNTAKGRHDICDYARGGLVMLASGLLAAGAVYLAGRILP